MGINIIVYRIKSVEEDEWGSKYFNIEKYENWDHYRHVGDREFANSVEFDTRWDGDITIEESRYNDRDYLRPSNFNDARKWVEENIENINKKRLLDILNIMEKETDLYFYASW